MKRKVAAQNVQKELEVFEKNNPEIVKAMELFDLSMANYEQTIRSLEPVKLSTSSSTKAI